MFIRRGLWDKYKGGNAVAHDGCNDELSGSHSESILFLRRVACARGLDAVHNTITRCAT